MEGPPKRIFFFELHKRQWEVDKFNPQSLAITAWAYATAGQWDVSLFVVLTRVVERRVGEFLGTSYR